MQIAFQGLTINLSIFQISDILALIIVLIVTSFDLISPKVIKQKWLRILIIVAASLIFLVAQHFLLRQVTFLSNKLPDVIEVRWYGILIMLGALGAALMTAWGQNAKDCRQGMYGICFHGC